VYAYLHNDDAPEVANPETVKISSEDRLKPGTSRVHSYSTASVDVGSRRSPSDEQNSEIKIPAKKPRTVKNFTAVKEMTTTNKLDEEFQHVKGMSDASSKWSLLSASSSASGSQTSSYSETSDSQSSSHVKTDIGKEDFLLRPGSFRVVLCVDNQEFYAKYVSFCLCVCITLCVYSINYPQSALRRSLRPTSVLTCVSVL